jgi:hypothetical protein
MQPDTSTVTLVHSACVGNMLYSLQTSRRARFREILEENLSSQQYECVFMRVRGLGGRRQVVQR